MMDCVFSEQLSGSKSLDAFLALAIAGFSTAVIQFAPRFLGLFSGHRQSSKQLQPTSKGASR